MTQVRASSLNKRAAAVSASLAAHELNSIENLPGSSRCCRQHLAGCGCNASRSWTRIKSDDLSAIRVDAPARLAMTSLKWFYTCRIMNEKAAVATLSALAQEARLRVFRALVGAGPAGMTPSALAAMLGIPASTLSFHLKELTHAGLVDMEREGRNLHYRPALDHMNDLLAYLTDHCCQGRPCAPTRGKSRTTC